MSVFLSPVGGAGAQFFDNNGNPLTGGKLYTYAAGTTTPQATYTSAAGSTFHTNPIVLDAAGRVPGSSEIWLADSQIYKFVLKDSNDVLLATWDQITGVNSNFVNYTAETEVQTATAGQTVFTLTTMSYVPGTGNLTVFVDGVNQYEGTSYAETDSTTVTFTAGLHVGALVKFTTAVQTTGNATDASVVTYDPPFTGSVSTTVEDKLAQTVSVTDFGAVGDGVTDDTTAFTDAATYAGSIGGNLYVPPPTSSYLLNSDPTVPVNVNFQASPSWFTGTGKLPMMSFVSLSEGVDPRIFATKVMAYTETAPNETKRKWAVNGWVNYKNAPAAGFEGTVTDAVGVDGRGVTNVANGRVWGMVALGQLDSGVSGVAQAYAAEFDINNNNANITSFDVSPTAKGVVVASGGDYQPETGIFLIATKTPTNTLGDNRFFAGWRFYQDCYKEFGIHFDDNCKNVAIRIPSTSTGVRFTKANSYNFDLSLNDVSYRGQMFAPAGKGIDIVKSTGDQLIGINETNVNFNVPLCEKTNTQSVPVSLDSSAANIFSISTAGTISGGIVQGTDGQRITIINVSSGTVTVSKNVNMRTIGGAAVTLAPLELVEFVYAYPTYFQVGAPVSLA